MSAGKLSDRIELQSATENNSFGSVTTTYTTVSTVFAYVKTQSGGEAFEAARVNAKETLRVKIRARADITTKWRIGWDGQYYNVTAVDRSESGYTWLTAQAVGAL